MNTGDQTVGFKLLHQVDQQPISITYCQNVQCSSVVALDGNARRVLLYIEAKGITAAEVAIVIHSAARSIIL